MILSKTPFAELRPKLKRRAGKDLLRVFKFLALKFQRNGRCIMRVELAVQRPALSCGCRKPRVSFRNSRHPFFLVNERL